MKGAVEIKNLSGAGQISGRDGSPTSPTTSSLKSSKTSASKNNGVFSTAILATGPNQRTYGYQVLAAWLDGNLAVMPRNALYDRGEKAATAKARQLKEMADSENNAAIAAWSYLKEIARLQVKSMPTWRASDVKIALKNTGGGSAGLAFALALIAKSADPNLIAGRKVAATGTISQDGKVGEIGGVDQKVIGAKENGIEIFIMPKSNCATLSKSPAGVKIYAVSTLSEAVHALAFAQSGAGALSVFTCPKK